MQDNSQRNLSFFNIFFIPTIAVAKTVRWTIMYNVLVRMSLGHIMSKNIRIGNIVPFHLTLFDSSGDVARTNAEAFFSAFNILSLTEYIPWEIFFTIIYNFILYFLIRNFYNRRKHVGWKESLFIYLNVAMLNIFCFNMAKEPYQILFFFLLAIALTRGRGYNAKLNWVVIALIITTSFCRKYYALLIIFLFVIHFFVNKVFDNIDTSTKKGKSKMYRNILLMVVIFAVFHYIFMSTLAGGVSESTYEQLINANYRDANRLSVAVSEIYPIFGNGNQLFVTLDFIVKVFRLMLPVELLAIGKVTYLFLIVNQLLLLVFIVRAFMHRNDPSIEDAQEELEEIEERTSSPDSNLQKIDDDNNETETFDEEEVLDETSLEHKDIIETRVVALYLFLAFLLTSAAFEPDFGSWTRHMAVAFPILLYII